MMTRESRPDNSPREIPPSAGSGVGALTERSAPSESEPEYSKVSRRSTVMLTRLAEKRADVNPHAMKSRGGTSAGISLSH